MLAEKIADRFGQPLGKVELKTFSNGEVYCRYEESVRGADLFLIQSCHGYGQSNDHLMELLVMAQAAKLAGAKRITAVMPWYPYSRQDKKSSAREPITSKLVADMLAVSGIERLITVDLHAGQIQGFFPGPVDHMTAIPIFTEMLAERGLTGEGVVMVAPDAGRGKVARLYADHLDCDLAMLSKHRGRHEQAAVSHLAGDVAGKCAVLTDDIIATGGTLAAGARALHDAGATSVIACATHAVFPDGALERLDASPIDEIIVTDTLPSPDDVGDHPKIRVISIADVLAITIGHVYAGLSVSELFGGENHTF